MPDLDTTSSPTDSTMNEPMEHEATTEDANAYDDGTGRNANADESAAEEEPTSTATSAGPDFTEAETTPEAAPDDADGTETNLVMAEPSMEDHRVIAPLLPPMTDLPSTEHAADSPSTSSSPRPEEETPQEHSCKCLKSRCLKLYCDCFRHNSTCTDACSCHACHNTDAQNGPGGARTLAMLAILRGRPGAFDAGLPIMRGRNEESVVAAYEEGKRAQMEEDEYAAAPTKRGRARSAVTVREDGVFSPTRVKKIKPSKWTLPPLDPIPIPQYTVEQVLSEFPPLIDPPPFTLDEYPTLALDPSTDYSSLVKAFKEPLFKEPSPPLQIAYSHRDYAIAQRSRLHDKKTAIIERLDAIRREFAATKAELLNLNLLLKQNSQMVGGWTHKVFELELSEKPCGFNEKLERLREFVERYGVLPSHGMKRLNVLEGEGGESERKGGETETDDGEDPRASADDHAEGDGGSQQIEGVKEDNAHSKSPVMDTTGGPEGVKEDNANPESPVIDTTGGSEGNEDVQQKGDVDPEVATDKSADDNEGLQEGGDVRDSDAVKEDEADDTNADVTPKEKPDADANDTVAVAEEGAAAYIDEGAMVDANKDVAGELPSRDEMSVDELQLVEPSIEEVKEDMDDVASQDAEQSMEQAQNEQPTDDKENEQPNEQPSEESNTENTEKQLPQPQFTDEEAKSLATFISAMKLKVKKNKSIAKLYPHRIQALQECGVRLFENENDARFDVMFEKLLAYKKEMGTFRMPSLDLCKDSGDEELIALHNWVFSQIGSFRYQLKTKKVRDVQKFLDVGFSFEKWYGSNGHVFERDIPAFDAMARKYVENGGVVPPEYEEMMRGQGKFAGRKRKSLHGPKVKRYPGPDRRLKRNRAQEDVDVAGTAVSNDPAQDEPKQDESMAVEAVDENQAMDVSEQVAVIKSEAEPDVEDQPSLDVVAMDV